MSTGEVAAEHRPQGYESEIAKLAPGAATSDGSGLMLPPARSLPGRVSCAEQGWLADTEVREATIKAAGNGRYLKKGVFEDFAKIAKGSVVVRKAMIPMKQVKSLKDQPHNASITFEESADLEKYIALAQQEGDYSREQILKLYEHFVYGFDGRLCCLNQCTYTVNHADETSGSLNVSLREVRNDEKLLYYEGVATRDINVGDEFYIDYRRFKLPDFYLKFAEENSFEDVRKATLKAVYGKDDPDVCGTPTDTWQSISSEQK